jgi:hypothetical protein
LSECEKGTSKRLFKSRQKFESATNLQRFYNQAGPKWAREFTYFGLSNKKRMSLERNTDDVSRSLRVIQNKVVPKMSLFRALVNCFFIGRYRANLQRPSLMRFAVKAEFAPRVALQYQPSTCGRTLGCERITEQGSRSDVAI